MPRRALAAVALAGAVLTLGSPVAPAAAATSRPIPVEALGELSPSIVGVPAGGAAYARAWDAWEEAGRELLGAEQALTSAGATLAEADATATRLEAERRALAAEHERTAAALDDSRGRVVDLAVAGFIGGAGNVGSLVPGEADAAARRRVFGQAVTDRTVAGYHAAEDAEAAARSAEATATELAAQAVADLEAARQIAADAEGRRASWAAALADRTAALTEAVPLADVDGTDLTVVTLDAYVRGADRSAGCVDWSLLAGIGKVETRHGTYRGSSVEFGGDVVPRIVGIPLDGTNQTVAIGDTDGGAIDGDAATDRAVGPMQFIPSTWRRDGLDGSGDGTADPNNLYDAAASAAAYLCRAGGSAARQAAVFSYNHSPEYVADVTAAADRYATLVW